MATKKNSWRILLIVLLLVLLLLFLICRFSSCKWCVSKETQKADTTNYVQNSNWNVLFKDGVSQPSKENAIQIIKEGITKFYTDYNSTYGTDFIPKFDPVAWCPCDSALYNLSFYCIHGAGGSKSSSPPPKEPKGSGNLADVLFVSKNLTMAAPKEPSYPGGDSVNTFSVAVKNIPVDNDKILAVIDTGIDTTLFQEGIQRLLWSDVPGKQTLHNFFPGQPVDDLSDSGKSKHGSAVVALAINAMAGAAKYPRLMILKALDKREAGSVFTVSCAMSYAIQKNATIINASLGYYGDADSIMQHYAGLTNSHSPSPVQLFVAAGNTVTDYPHDRNKLCSGAINNNELTAGRLFYPACFNKQFSNITNVTQVTDTNADSSCFYQNFSNEYVTLGVQNLSNCCAFKVDFRQTARQYYEGSSFATPVASGIRMATLLNNTTEAAANAAWRSLIKTAPQKRITINGNYIIYTEH